MGKKGYYQSIPNPDLRAMRENSPRRRNYSESDNSQAASIAIVQLASVEPPPSDEGEPSSPDNGSSYNGEGGSSGGGGASGEW